MSVAMLIPSSTTTTTTGPMASNQAFMGASLETVMGASLEAASAPVITKDCVRFGQNKPTENASAEDIAAEVNRMTWYQKLAAPLSFKNLGHGFDCARQAFGRIEGPFHILGELMGIAIDLGLMALSHGLILPFHVIFPTSFSKTFEAFFSGLQEAQATRQLEKAAKNQAKKAA